MPELPDVELYLAALRRRIVSRVLERVRLATPFLLRSVDPPLDAAVGARILGLRRLGKRIVWQFDNDLFFVFHLMIAGRFRWRPAGAVVPKRVGLAAFDFDAGTLLVTEAGGRCSDMKGGPHNMKSPHLLTDNGATHQETLELFAEVFEGRFRVPMPVI